VADIHFNPNAAEIAATLVEKVRINPGNFSGGAKKFELTFSEEAYAEELDIAERKLIPFLRICKDNGTALRIGTNHGSLSDRIMSRFGDTPQGMVEACMEYLRICEKVDFKDIILSIKASNTRIMVYTVRLLVATMKSEGMMYPLHLGVTEAGSEDEGRIKSAVGTGALLVDGLGDTIRVSLTEDPEKEVPVAKKLVNHIHQRINHSPITPIKVVGFTPYEYNRRATHAVLNIGLDNVPVVISTFHSSLKEAELKPDYVYCATLEDATLTDHKTIVPLPIWKQMNQQNNHFPLVNTKEFLDDDFADQIVFLNTSIIDFDEHVIAKLTTHAQVVLLISSSYINTPVEQRAFILKLNLEGLTHPVLIHNAYQEDDLETLQIKAAADAGILFLDGFADGLYLDNKGEVSSLDLLNTSYGILQASRARFTKTEFISCPGCGRTLFNLQETTKEIKKRTSHLKGLKIGVMGCIVNGVGEMADADYGYIGSGPNTVSLFKKRELVLRNIEGGKIAVEALINLIKENGDWMDN